MGFLEVKKFVWVKIDVRIFFLEVPSKANYKPLNIFDILEKIGVKNEKLSLALWPWVAELKNPSTGLCCYQGGECCEVLGKFGLSHPRVLVAKKLQPGSHTGRWEDASNISLHWGGKDKKKHSRSKMKFDKQESLFSFESNGHCGRQICWSHFESTLLPTNHQ